MIDLELSVLISISVVRIRDNMKPISKQILTFLFFVFLFSSVPYELMIHSGHIGAGNGMVVRLVMWCPTFAALATSAVYKIDLATLGWNWRPAKYEWLAYLLPIFYALPVYLGCWIFVSGSFDYAGFSKHFADSYYLPQMPNLATLGLGLPLLATLGVVMSMGTALGEEIGWRGFLLPRLTGRFGFTVGCLISGAVWAVWHYPGLLWADYNAGTQPVYALACFTLMVIPMAFVMGWLRLKSGSLWPCAMLHASHNLFIQAIFDELTKDTGRAKYVTTEFGFGLVLVMWAVAAYFWTKRKELKTA